MNIPWNSHKWDIEKQKHYMIQRQKMCPVCKRPASMYMDRHHYLIRRDKNKPQLDVPCLNLMLVCSLCHVPEAPGLALSCAELAKDVIGLTFEEIDEWIDSLGYKLKPNLSESFHEVFNP